MSLPNVRLHCIARVVVLMTLAATCLCVDAAEPVADPGPGTLPAYSAAGSDTCLGCHNDERMLAIFRTAHGQQADPAAPMAHLQCETCHGPGSEHSGRRRAASGHQPVIEFGPEAVTAAADQDAVCLGCHASARLPWTDSVHERNGTACSGCHSLHTATDPVLTRASQNDVCFACHRKQQSDSRKPSAHPTMTDNPLEPAAMVCGDCHDPHGSAAGAELVRDTTNELCLTCHAEYRGPVLFDHAPVSEDCALCHQPHGSIHPALLVRRPPLLCQSCHSQRGHPSIAYTDNSLPGGNPSAMLVGRNCMNCHTQVHGSNHPSGSGLLR
jgi:DmsE family decaheme c-type cytochrome